MRERASRVGEGRRPRLEAKARGERSRPPRARALASPSSRGRPRSPASPPPSRGFCRARVFTLFPLPHGNGARRRLHSSVQVRARSRREEGSALARGPARLIVSPPRAAGEVPCVAALSWRGGGGGGGGDQALPLPRDPFPRSARASPSFLGLWSARSLPDFGAPRSPLSPLPPPFPFPPLPSPPPSLKSENKPWLLSAEKSLELEVPEV